MNHVLPNEFEHVKKFFTKRLYEKAILNNEDDNYIVKLDVLHCAQKLGLKIPSTLVTQSKEELSFLKILK